MKFLEIFRFELGVHLRRASTWFYFIAVLGVTYRIATEGYIGISQQGGFLYNGSFVIASLIMTASLLGLLIAAAIAGDAAARDIQTRMHPLFYSAPVSKRAYLGGRFLAAHVLNALIMLAAPIALVLATFASGLQPEQMGPFRPELYIVAYLAIAVPNAFVATALMFAIAALTRRAMAAYIGSVLLFTVAILSLEFIARQLGMWDLARLIDPIGIIELTQMSKTWTPAQKSTELIGLQGSLVLNRLLWVAIGLGAFAFTHFRFRFAHPVAGVLFKPRVALRSNDTDEANATIPIAVPRAQPGFGSKARVRQTVAVAMESLRVIVSGWGALIVVGMTVFLIFLVPSLMEHMEVPMLPSTEEMTAIFTSDDLLWLFIPLLVVFYAGELVWRERDVGMSDIADAAPVPEWTSLIGKFLGLTLSLIVLQTVMMGAAVLVQAILGYYHFELGVYAKILFGIKLVDYLLFAAIALVVHVVVNHKYVAHLIAFSVYLLMVFAATFGIHHNLLAFGADPGWDYSDLRGFGNSLAPYFWFKLYWASWAFMLVVLARAFWIRGREQGVHARLAFARRRLTRPVIGLAALSVALIITLGGFVFYNTNVLNEYETSADGADWRAEYERRYGFLEGRAQPEITATTLRIEIVPKRRRAVINGNYRLVNRTAAAIDTVYVATDDAVQTTRIAFARAATQSLRDDRFRHHAYVLAEPLQPGDTMDLNFEAIFQPRGFTNTGIDASIVPNGTYFQPTDWLPTIGYRAGRELVNAVERKLRGLPPRQAVRSLQQGAPPDKQAPRIQFDAIIGTEDEETALAPGRLLRSWKENGRRYFHYRTDARITNDYAIFSAAYAVRKARWNGVDIEIYHHPGHDHNVDRMIRSMRASLSYMGEKFGEYPHGQIRMVEHASEGTSLHAFPVNISYEEGFSRFDPDKDKREMDLPFGVVAHEVAHQWWGHVVTPAQVEGSPLLTESLAWFSALGIVEKAYGADHMRRLVGMLREANLTPRMRADVPLLRAHDWYTGYRKGPFAMYALREYVGEDRVNVALQRMIEKYGAGKPPLPTSLDLLRELETVTPDSLRYLLVDLFEVNTFWGLETNKATAKRAAGGRWTVTLDVEAKKVAVDSAGAETVLPMNDLVEIGVYALEENGNGGKEIYRQLHRIRPGPQRIMITVQDRPGRGGIDPRNLLIDTEPRDNVVKVSEIGAGAP